MALTAGTHYYAVPQNYLVNIGGDVRSVYALICGEEGSNRIAVPQNATAAVSGDQRPIYGTAGCIDGQLVPGQRVIAIPQGYTATISGDTRPVYAFVCCAGSPCCGALPNTLHVTFSNNTGNFGNASYAMTWNGTEWFGNLPDSCTAEFFCNSVLSGPCTYDLIIKNSLGQFVLQILSACGSAQNDWASASCSPLQLVTNPDSAFGGSELSFGAVTTVTT